MNIPIVNTQGSMDLPNKLIAAISDYINDLRGTLNVKHVATQFNKAKIQ